MQPDSFSNTGKRKNGSSTLTNKKVERHARTNFMSGSNHNALTRDVCHMYKVMQLLSTQLIHTATKCHVMPEGRSL